MKNDLLTPDIIPYDPALRGAIIDVWESSVRTTHKFLHPEDIAFYKTIVESMDFAALELYCIPVDQRIAGFIAVAGKKIEMLFLAPGYLGRGLGKRLLQFAISRLSATMVDVNEQNTQALRFYEYNGFSTFSRSDTDDAGKPYPILNMRFGTRTD